MRTTTWPQRLDGLLPRLDNIVRRVGLRVTRWDFDLRHAPRWQRDIVAQVTPFTATDGPALLGLLDAIGYLEVNSVQGAIVECGVYRGGSVMAAASALLHHGSREREVWLYDTFDGMTEPTVRDVRARDGLAARDIHTNESDLPESAQSDWYWVRAGIDSVRENVAQTGYPESLIRYVEGRVEDTIPSSAPESIALLRLDTDWYESTKHELEHLVPRVVAGGVLIVDDYHYWNGSRQAVDEYFGARVGRTPLWTRISSSGAVLTVL